MTADTATSMSSSNASGLYATRRSMYQRVLAILTGNLGATSATNFVLMGLGLLTGSLGAHLLGPSGRGQLAAIQLWPMTAIALGSGGLQESLVYFCARDRRDSGSIAMTTVALLCLLGPIWVVAGVMGMPHLLAAEPMSVVTQARIYMFVVPVLFVVFAAYGVLQGTHAFGLWNFWRLSLPAGYAVVLVVSACTPGNRVTTVAFGYMAWVTLHLLFATWVFKTKLQGSPSVRREYVRPLTRYGLLSVGANAPAMANQRFDQLVMAAFVPSRLLGLYAVAVTWSMAVTPLSNAFSQVILPRLASASDAEAAAQALARAGRVVTSAAIVIASGFLVVTPLFIQVLCGPAFSPAIPATLILVVAAMFLGMNQFLEEAVRGLGRPGLAAIAELAAIGITIPGLYLLLPRWGILGAAVTSLSAYAVALGFLTVLVCRNTGLTPGDLFLLKRSDISAISRRLRPAS